MKSKQERLEFLKENAVFFSRLGFGYDPPMRDSEGRWLLFDRDFEKYISFHKEFAEAGIPIHTFLLPSGWIDDGVFDYTATDEVLNAICEALPDVYVLPRIKLNAPLSWCQAHPEDVFVYDGGPTNAQEIAATVGTLKQDILGYDAPGGYAVNGGTFRDTRPNVGGVIGLQSFSSPRWVADASDALKRLIRHLESGKHGAQIIGYHLAFGNCGETTLWGAWSQEPDRKGDFGITASARFRAQTGLSVPRGETRYGIKRSLSSFFRKDEAGACASAYDSFINQTAAEAISAFCRAAKHEAPEKAVGIFYGYLLNVPLSAYAGHAAFESVLNDTSIDFISSPKGYYFCGADGPGLEQAPTQSIARKKLWLDEIDNLTHIDVRNSAAKPACFEETRAVLCREFAKNVAAKQSYWWMDLGEGSFHDPLIMKDIKTLTAFAKELSAKEGNAMADVLFVLDDAAFLRHAPSYTLHRSFIQHLPSLIKQCGALCDLYRLCDLPSLPLERYKLIVFLNAYTLSKEAFASLKCKAAKNALFLWCYAAGASAEKEALRGIHQLTNFSVAELPNDPSAAYAAYNVPDARKNDFPFLGILEDGESEILLRSNAGNAICAAKGNDILLVHPQFDRAFLRSVLSRANVHCYAPEGCTVYGDDRFLYVIANEKVNGALRLPFCADVENVLTGETHKDVTALPLVSEEKRGFLFRLSAHL